MSIVATQALLPKEKIVDAALTKLHLRNGATRDVLAIERFDRTPQGGKIHFEELNQLLGHYNADRYNGSYSDIAGFIRQKMGQEGVKRFYARLLCQFLLGNVDNHFKNFAMFHGEGDKGWELTPDYDLAPSVNYDLDTKADYTGNPRQIKGGLALTIQGAAFSSPTYRNKDVIRFLPATEHSYKNLDPKTLVTLGLQFGLGVPEIKKIIQDIVANIPNAKAAVMNDSSPELDTEAGDAAGRKSSGHDTCRQDFCRRIDGRQQQFFGTLDRYLRLIEEKGVDLSGASQARRG